jgi:hypothetical protein
MPSYATGPYEHLRRAPDSVFGEEVVLPLIERQLRGECISTACENGYIKGKMKTRLADTEFNDVVNLDICPDCDGTGKHARGTNILEGLPHVYPKPEKFGV